jgi:type IV secretion system protein TrbF
MSELLDAPFLRARDAWDNRLSNLTISRHNWMLCAGALLLLDFLLTAALIIQVRSSKVVPYVVEVDRHGHAVAFGPAEVLRNPEEREIRYFLSELVYCLRAVLRDPKAQERNLNRAYAFLREPASTYVNSYFRSQNPFARAKTATVSVQVTSILRIAPQIWQAQWTERTFGLDGRGRTEPWQAIFKVRVSPPSKSDTLLTNPLGLVVEDIDWTRLSN